MPKPKCGQRSGNHEPTLSETEKETGKKGSQSQPIIRPEEWITKAEAARLRGVSRQAIAKLVKKGKFQTLQIGGRAFLKRTEVVAYQPEPAGRPPKS